ncbi:glycoside hydrolase 5 family protein [Labilibaculum antarcticum]|uniref:mannan endo-1,4-beta-mannosidase n=1 Tax=Labilibaculum antarcticum TaxID=1717717 RepID=A0A1Y1CG19_9BACT|nr:hypothetical protein [Labilibaculum antarcticum]BAX79318.1 hypothetical protein ALGA_0931 [Labilibaculum antarcticum]
MCILPLLSVGQENIENFISVKGNKLMNGDKEFRFVSFNIPTLNYNEDVFEFDRLHPYSLPDEFEIRDVMETVKQVGGQVIRMYTLPVRIENESNTAPTYIEGPGQFVEESFKTMDLVLALANEYNIRIVFSTLNNFRWMGGVPQYCGFRGKDRGVFYTDPEIIADYKATLNFVINRKNSITGEFYKDDKAILCWETGNELYSTPEWTNEICGYIKSLDKNHLTMDGFFAFDDRPVMESSIGNPNVDIICSHHYELNPAEFVRNVKRNIELIDGKKPYLIGECGFVSTTALEMCIDYVINSDITGLLVWGIRGHRSEGGFYWHSEPLGYGRYKAYHWPGFESGSTYDEKNLFAMMRKQASKISGNKMPELSAPSIPELLPIAHVSTISWKGSTGALGYDIYRSEKKKGPYKLVGYNISDAVNQYVPLFEDNTAKKGKSYYYRIKAKNEYGSSDYSNTVGPVKVETLGLIDNMNNFGKVYFSTENVSLETDRDRVFKEDMYRFKAGPEEKMIYYVPGNIKRIRIYSFCQQAVSNLRLLTSKDNDNYKSVDVQPNIYDNGKGDYGYWVPIVHDVEVNQESSYLKIEFNLESQISRVELYYE